LPRHVDDLLAVSQIERVDVSLRKGIHGVEGANPLAVLVLPWFSRIPPGSTKVAVNAKALGFMSCWEFYQFKLTNEIRGWLCAFCHLLRDS
jgi:hypothetical protein